MTIAGNPMRQAALAASAAAAATSVAKPHVIAPAVAASSSEQESKDTAAANEAHAAALRNAPSEKAMNFSVTQARVAAPAGRKGATKLAGMPEQSDKDKSAAAGASASTAAGASATASGSAAATTKAGFKRPTAPSPTARATASLTLQRWWRGTALRRHLAGLKVEWMPTVDADGDR
jgi:hypothetical protein